MPPIDRPAAAAAARDHLRVARTMGGILVACSLLTACGDFLSPRPDPSRFYVLTATASAGAPRAPGSFGVGPVKMPDYLKRSTIVTWMPPNEISPSPIDRWGDPLDRAIPRTVQENLRLLLATDEVVLFPWYPADRPDLQAVIDVLRFERDDRGSVRLVARWEIRDPETGATLRTGETRSAQQATAADMSASVLAQSEALAELSRDIAAAIRAAPRR
jgi:uncharacterized protein